MIYSAQRNGVQGLRAKKQLPDNSDWDLCPDARTKEQIKLQPVPSRA